MICIRADMNPVIASGHMMRCLAIGQALRQKGEDACFVVADCQPVPLLEKLGYSFFVLHTSWEDMEQELPALEGFIKKYGIKCMLIDSYQVTESYLKAVSSLVKTIYLDDLHLFSYPVHMVICYANYWKRLYPKGTSESSGLVGGTEYVPLMPEFSFCKKKRVKETIENLLLLSGGGDNCHALEQILGHIDLIRYRRVDVVCGRYHPDYEKLLKTYENKRNIYFHRNVSNMKRYMEQADAAVTAGGTALYELCAVGTPAVSYALAENQRLNVQQFSQDGIIPYAGEIHGKNTWNQITEYLNQYHHSRILRQEKSEKMQKLVDGKGAGRIADILKMTGGGAI